MLDMIPLLNTNVNVSLAIEPVIVSGPLFCRICKAELEGPNELRNQFIDFAQRYLAQPLATTHNASTSSAHILADTGTRPSTKLYDCLIH